MVVDVSLRNVHDSDLPLFFEHQLDPDATHMASFPSRQRDDFMAHWAKVMADADTVVRTIVADGQVAGYVVVWDQKCEAKLGYWLGREFWGQRIASSALARFLSQVPVRPLHARVAESNVASIRVLQKCGFAVVGRDTFTRPDGGLCEGCILSLGAKQP